MFYNIYIDSKSNITLYIDIINKFGYEIIFRSLLLIQTANIVMQVPVVNSQKTFLNQLSGYVKFNYFLIAMGIFELLLTTSVLISNLLCRQGLPIALYNIIAQVFTTMLPIACIVAVSSFKYFNTVLAYSILVLLIKAVQVASLIVFSHVGTCALPLLYRLPVAIYFIIELSCLALSSWILKRVRRFDRQNKAAAVMKTKQFLSD